MASVASAADIDALDAVIAGGHKAVAKMAREHGDLRQQIQDAYQSRAAALNGYDTASALTDLLARIEAATLIADVMAIEANYQAGRAMFEVAEQDQIETAIDAAKAKMKGAK
jgi:sigma54-dependent transcription regulator